MTPTKTHSNMTISLVLTSLEGFSQDGKILFYGESARALWAICGNPQFQDEKYLGCSWGMDESQMDIVSPRIVKAGYSMKITNGTRLNH